MSTRSGSALRTRFDAGGLLLVVCGALAAALVLLRQTRFGPGLTPDSAAYLSVARNLMQGDGLVPCYGDFVHYPPLFPVMLAFAGQFADDLTQAAATLNALCCGGCVVLMATWPRRCGASLAVAVWTGLAAAFSLALANVAAYVWSESLFLLLALLSLSSLHRFLAGGARRALAVSACAAALCCLTRYAGLSVVACAVLLLFFRPGAGASRRARVAGGYALVGLGPVAVWVGRNLVAQGTALGDRADVNDFSALASIDTAAGQMLEWVLGPLVAQRLEPWLAMVADATAAAPAPTGAALKLGLLIAVGGLVGWRCAVVCRGRASRTDLCAAIAVPTLFAVCYFAMLAAALPLAGLGDEKRYFAPAHAPLLVAAAMAIGMAWANASRPMRAIGAVLLALWLAQWMVATRHDIAQWRHGSDGYGAKRWVRSETVRHLATSDSLGADSAGRGAVFSNDPLALCLLAGKWPRGAGLVRPAERPRLAGAVHNVGELDGMAADLRGRQAHVVWFKRPRMAQRHSLTDLVGALPTLEVVALLGDGIVFRHPAEEGRGGTAARLTGAHLKAVRRRVAAARFEVFESVRGTLTYARRGCAPEDVLPRFFLHVVPQDAGVLRPGWRFENLDFSFAWAGLRHGDTCVASVGLPSYRIAAVRTGQWHAAQGELWSVSFTPRPPR